MKNRLFFVCLLAMGVLAFMSSCNKNEYAAQEKEVETSLDIALNRENAEKQALRIFQSANFQAIMAKQEEVNDKVGKYRALAIKAGNDDLDLAVVRWGERGYEFTEEDQALMSSALGLSEKETLAQYGAGLEARWSALLQEFPEMSSGNPLVVGALLDIIAGVDGEGGTASDIVGFRSDCCGTCNINCNSAGICSTYGGCVRAAWSNYAHLVLGGTGVGGTLGGLPGAGVGFSVTAIGGAVWTGHWLYTCDFERAAACRFCHCP